MKRVALFGGSFNPPHVGHLLAAVYMRSVRGVDEVWLVPSAQHPFGKVLPPFDDRVSWCEALAKDFEAWMKVSRAETQVGKEGRTIDLLHHLIPLHSDTRFSLVLGSDILDDLPKWKAWSEIEQLVEVVILLRAGYPSPRAVGPPLAQISSTEIRDRMGRGDAVEALVPKRVLEAMSAGGHWRAKNE